MTNKPFGINLMRIKSIWIGIGAGKKKRETLTLPKELHLGKTKYLWKNL